MTIDIMHGNLLLRSAVNEDIAFLYLVYASTRADEMALTGWPQEQIDWFLHMQFDLQHTQWQQNFPKASFDVILQDDKPVGRLYVDRRETEIHIIDIAILPEYRGRGIATYFLKRLTDEAKQKGVKLSLYVEKNNPARSLYQRLGFSMAQEGDVYDLMELTP